MAPSSSFLHLLLFLIAAVGLIFLVELFLYGLLKFWNHWSFWWIVGPVSIAFGVWLAHIMRPLDADGTLVDQGWSYGWGAFGTIAMLSHGLLHQKVVKGRWAIPLLMMAPCLLAVCLLIVIPFAFEVRLAFANLNLYSIGRWIKGGDLGFVGFDHFIAVFTTSPLQTATFWQLLVRTILWTVINMVAHVGFGLFLAMLLNYPIKGKGIYRTILIFPWAIPQVVAVLSLRGEFHPQFGMVNQILQMLHLPTYNWWSDPIPTFISCCLVNIWLGIPFMMIVFLGGLQSIPKSYYEAASIDGASKVAQFFQITLPMLKPVVVPSVTLGTIWTFNNINVIYLMTGQDGGRESADILVSALYKSAFTYSRYSFSAAFALVLFAILLAMTTLWMKISKGTDAGVAR